MKILVDATIEKPGEDCSYNADTTVALSAIQKSHGGNGVKFTVGDVNFIISINELRAALRALDAQ